MTAYDYTYKNLLSPLMMSEWTFRSYETCSTDVIPDGCRDIIVEKRVGQKPLLFLSELSQATYSVSSSGGALIRGIRLRAGVQVQEATLNSWLKTKNAEEIFCDDQLSEFCFELDNLSDALACLQSETRTVANAAKNLGVSLRTLERLIKSGTGRSPHFWYSLARVRRTARSLYKADSLGAAAIEAGYTDQSHMSREMKKWFRKTPAQIVSDDNIRSALLEPGYG